jgi:hypothetical protein
LWGSLLLLLLLHARRHHALLVRMALALLGRHAALLSVHFGASLAAAHVLLMMLLLLKLLQLELLPLQLLELLIDHLILLREIARRHTSATHGILHHRVHSRHTHTGHSKWHTSKGHATTASHGVGHELGLFLELGGTVAAHAEAEARVFSQEEFVVVRAHFGSTGHTSKAPSVELSGKAGELGSFEELGKNL